MRLTYANVVATLALVVAVAGSGTALAAGHLPKNSVVSKSIKNGSIQGKDIKDGSISAADLAPGTVPAAPPTSLVVAGATMPAGGSEASLGAYSPDMSVSDVARVTITVPAAGYVELTGQGYFRASPKPDYIRAELREPSTGTSVQVVNWSAGVGGTTDYALSQSVVGVVPVTTGTHTYALNLTESTYDGAAHSKYSARVVAAYFPAGSVAP